MSKVKYQWPDRFEYIVKLNGRNCVAIKNTADMYNCYEFSERRLDSTIINYRSAADFEAVLEAGDIAVLTPLKKKVASDRKISINVNSVFHAAKWDVENNPFTKKRGDTIEIVQDKINDFVENLYNDVMNGEFEYHSIGCGSYTIQFLPEDDKYGVISVLVDPSVGQNSFYVDVKDYLEQT